MNVSYVTLSLSKGAIISGQDSSHVIDTRLEKVTISDQKGETQKQL